MKTYSHLDYPAQKKIKFYRLILILVLSIGYLLYASWYLGAGDRQVVSNDIFDPTTKEAVAVSDHWELKSGEDSTPFLVFKGKEEISEEPVICGYFGSAKGTTISARHFLLGEVRYYAIFLDVDRLRKGSTPLTISWKNKEKESTELLTWMT